MKTYGIALSGDAEHLGLGAMTDARWQEFFGAMAKEGVYPASLDYRNAYTLQFVDKGYALAAHQAATDK
jgi:NitT/TauT family transport system substrate-binding protein